MRTIVHLSDLHFGRTIPSLVQSLIQSVREIHPDLVAVSGDLTQRARKSQFQEAQAFLNSLPRPQIVVPGNHDIPLDNVVLRFWKPLARYKRYITTDLEPTYVDTEIAVLGLNTTRKLLLKNGRVSQEQVCSIEQHFGSLPIQQVRIIVTHHPFDVPKGFDDSQLVGRSRMAIHQFAKSGVDIFLAGHLHTTHAGSTERYNIAGYRALVIQAGTATSTRSRGEANAFNVIRIVDSELSVETHSWQSDTNSFQCQQIRNFRRMAPDSSLAFDRWVEVPASPK